MSLFRLLGSSMSIVSSTSPTKEISTTYIAPIAEAESADSAKVISSMVDLSAVETSIEPPRLSLVDEVRDAVRLGVFSPISEETSPSEPTVPITPISIGLPISLRPDLFLGLLGTSVTSSIAPALIPEFRRLEAGERNVGKRLKPEEKPRLIATLADEIVNGMPTKNVLFIRKLISERASIEKITILRKRIFLEERFSEIGFMLTDSTPIPAKYDNIIQSMPYKKSEIFIFEDNEIQKNNVYIYKIKIKWNELSEEEQRRRQNRLLSTLLSGSFSII